MDAEQRGTEAEVYDKNLTLCTSPPGCYLCRNSRWGEKNKTVLGASLCRALGKENMTIGDERKMAVYYLGIPRGSKEFTLLNAPNSLPGRLCSASFFPAVRDRAGVAVITY